MADSGGGKDNLAAVAAVYNCVVGKNVSYIEKSLPNFRLNTKNTVTASICDQYYFWPYGNNRKHGVFKPW